MRRPMLSLDNAFTDEDVPNSSLRVRRFLGLKEDDDLVITASPRSTGCRLRCATRTACSCRARRAATAPRARTSPPICRTINDIPLRLHGKAPKVLEVRGEVYMTHKDFAALNKRQEKDGKPLFVNPRNTAAGSVRQLDPAITRRGRCISSPTPGARSSALPAETQWGMLEAFKNCGFKVNPLMRRVRDGRMRC